MNNQIFNNKTILVTGGTGSFGNRFTETLLKKYKFKKLIIFSRDELKQYEMSEKFKNKKLRFFLGDVRDFERLNMAMKNVDIVVHAAALKQVPSAEYNPTECIKTNINGAENVIRASISNKVKKIIALSTDKSANPINLYGATKLVSDKLFIAANNITGGSNTIFSVVRYGNVVGSRGSVLPFFKKIIRNKSQNFLPITHKNMTRFWITLDQGINFVINSLFQMKGGEIFVPKLPSVKIIDLAKSLSTNHKLKIIGVRPGEKIHEIMCPLESSKNTIEFQTYYCIEPSIKFTNKKVNYLINKNKEKGKRVKETFEYSSETNPNFLKIKEIKKLNNINDTV